jgi:hypothetical protein
MQIHVARGGQELGVFSPAEVRARLNSGELMPTDFGWAEGHSQWTPLASFPGLSIPMTASPQTIRGVAGTTAAPATSGAAVASLVCGILSISFLPFFASLPAIICGHIARSNVKKSGGTLTGSGMALAGLIMGYFGFVLVGAAIAAVIALPVFASVQTKGLETKALANAKSLGVACRLYAVDNDGKYPAKLEDLLPTYLGNNREVLICPFDPSDPIGYVYYGAGMKDSDNSETKVFIVSKSLSKSKGRVVVYADTSGKVVKNMPELPPH